MVSEQSLPVKLVVVLLVIAVLFSALSVIVSLNVYNSFKSDYVPVRSTVSSDLGGSSSGQVALIVSSPPGVAS